MKTMIGLEGRSGELCPRLCPRAPDRWLTLANASQERNENPPVSIELTEGQFLALKLMRPLLCHLSYAADPGAEQRSYRLRERESSERE
jgi:hypothetical protein